MSKTTWRNPYHHPHFLEAHPEGVSIQDLGGWKLPWLQQKKRGFRYAYLPAFAQRLDPLESGEMPLLEALTVRVHYFDWQFSERLPIPEKLAGMITEQERKNYVLTGPMDFAPDRNVKNHLRKAEKNRLVAERVDFADIETGFGRWLFSRIPLPAKARTQFPELCTTLEKRKALECWSVKSEAGDVLAGGCYMLLGDWKVFLKSWVSDEGKKCGAGHLLMHKAIQSGMDQHFKFDFAGSDVPGVARFFRSFGGRETVYYRYCYNGLPRLVKLAIHLYRKMRR